MYDWERCDHRGIGQIGCPVCDFDKGRVMIRQQRLDNRDLRALNAELLAALAEIARPKFGGLEPSTTTEEALEYWNRACERERMTARAAIAKAEVKP